MLTLPEELLLLALTNQKGRVVSSSSEALPYGLAGAVLMELVLREKVRLEDEKVHVNSSAPTGDDILDDALAKIAGSAKVRRVKYWVGRPFSLVKGLQKRLLERLVDNEILRKEKHHFLWLIPYDAYPEANPLPEEDVRQRLRRAVLHGEKPDERAAVELALVHACKLEKEVFPDRDPKAVAKALERLSEEDMIGEAVSAQAAAAAAAVAAAAMVAATASISQASS